MCLVDMVVTQTIHQCALQTLQKLQRGDKLVSRGPPGVLCLFQADSHFPSRPYTAVLVDCLSLCLCKDIINTDYVVGSLISTKPCISDLFLLELFARMSNITSAIFSSTVFFWYGFGPLGLIEIAEELTFPYLVFIDYGSLAFSQMLNI